eukprot:CAMPEP_0172756070 /NCGR_PEP_ID=MMETSP1074-20121228/161094_1 /TAXON_ID=2916 /ORGANISM="Ceratium fusus, Strain PA161109" /LENGTH=144 /DNA_ID=CAMNT_0013589277 /DNA_START=21 /DNA_END=452 /DNA_ORIENTATION=-
MPVFLESLCQYLSTLAAVLPPNTECVSPVCFLPQEFLARPLSCTCDAMLPPSSLPCMCPPQQQNKSASPRNWTRLAGDEPNAPQPGNNSHNSVEWACGDEAQPSLARTAQCVLASAHEDHHDNEDDAGHVHVGAAVPLLQEAIP